MINKIWKILLIVLLLAITAGILYFYKYHYLPKIKTIEILDTDTLLVSEEITKMYGIPVDSYAIEFDYVKKKQMLLNILSSYHLPEGAIANLLVNDKKTFDFRKIRAGNRYTVFLDKDSAATLRYFVYEHTPVEFVRFSFLDTVTIEVGEKEVIQQLRVAIGSIHTSLWNAMIDNGLNPTLANELSEIYAWSIDFFGLQPADSFCVVYDEQYVDTLLVGLGKIHIAFFRHNNQDFYAIPFMQDSIENYFDLDGNSLRKSFLRAPLRFSRISSRYSHSRLHPILKIRRPHYGVDYVAPAGTPVQSVGDGTVVEVRRGYNNGGGNMIKIKHNSVYSTAYLHLSGFAPGIKPGVYVQQGDIIGYVGATGLATGPHLDFRFYMNGNSVDPLKVKVPPLDPIRKENQAAFDSAKTIALKLMTSSID
jgi:murein DD-endopeptidase MepM/ murein hydrolase activator NlpD